MVSIQATSPIYFLLLPLEPNLRLRHDYCPRSEGLHKYNLIFTDSICAVPHAGPPFQLGGFCVVTYGSGVPLGNRPER